MVMECYSWSTPADANGVPVRKYIKQMHTEWKVKELFEITERRLRDQARAMRKNGCLTELELEDIKQRSSGEAGHARNESGIMEAIDNFSEEYTVDYERIEINDYSNNENGLIIDRIFELLNTERTIYVRL